MEFPPEVLTLTKDCGPETCQLLPVWSGRNFRQYEIRDDVPPVGYIEECLYRVFLLYKEYGSRLILPANGLRVTTELDAAADAWLWMPPDWKGPSYSSRGRFTAWYRDVIAEMNAAKRQPSLFVI